MLIVKIISIIILVVSLKQLVNLSEKLNKTNHRNIKIHTEEFSGESISVSYFKNREEQSRIFNQPTLTYPVTIQELQNGRVRAEWNPVSMLKLRRFKDQRSSSHMTCIYHFF